MKEELKTLKDIERCGEDDDKIKAEAMKWIKEISKKNPNPYGDTDSVRWIKHFFNLTEEDLK